MRQNRLKRLTAMLMCGLLVVLVLWTAFGTRGDGSSNGIMFEETDAETDPEVISGVQEAETRAEEELQTSEETETEAEAQQESTDAGALLAMLNPADTIRRLNRYESHFDSMPPGGLKMRINPVGGTLGRVFNDSNYLHIESAEAIGIKPLHGIRDAWEAGSRLERLKSCEDYYLDNLTHSLPYLVPKAHRLLVDIGKAFRDSLQQRGGGDYRIKVTSVLRTPRLIKRLRRRNGNAVDTSAHLYGTTFDISYAKFICDSTRTPRTQEDMKNLLAEVVQAMRMQGRCYVKYERKQACFHITAR